MTSERERKEEKKKNRALLCESVNKGVIERQRGGKKCLCARMNGIGGGIAGFGFTGIGLMIENSRANGKKLCLFGGGGSK